MRLDAASISKRAPGRVLVLTANRAVAELVASTLSVRDCVIRTHDASSTLPASVGQWIPQVVLIDLDSTPGDLLGTMRKQLGHRLLGVIALTERRDLQSRIAVLEAGADDIVTLPCAAGELGALIKAALRRVSLDSESIGPLLHIGDLEINLLTRQVRVGPRSKRLTAHELALLMLLAANAGTVVSSAEILDAVWGSEFTTETNLVERHVSALRTKLGDDARHSRYVETVRGRGYRFVANEERRLIDGLNNSRPV